MSKKNMTKSDITDGKFPALAAFLEVVESRPDAFNAPYLDLLLAIKNDLKYVASACRSFARNGSQADVLAGAITELSESVKIALARTDDVYATKRHEEKSILRASGSDSPPNALVLAADAMAAFDETFKNKSLPSRVAQSALCAMRSLETGARKGASNDALVYGLSAICDRIESMFECV